MKTGYINVPIHKFSSLYGRNNLRGVPVMQFETREVAFGKVKRGEKREYTYRFTNEGDVPLVIEIISACDCTTTEYDTRPYKPGESGEIKVVFDSTEKEEAEEIQIDIILENREPGVDVPIFEQIVYTFDIE